MKINDVVAIDDGVLALEVDDHEFLKLDLNKATDEEITCINYPEDYDCFSSVQIDSDKTSLIWPEGQSLGSDFIKDHSKREIFAWSLSRFPRKLAKDELDELIEVFMEIATDVFQNCAIYFYGDYVNGLPDQHSTANFLVVAKRTFNWPVICSHMAGFFYDLCYEFFGPLCLPEVLLEGFEKDPIHEKEVKIMKNAKRLM